MLSLTAGAGAGFSCRNCLIKSFDAGPMDALHLLLQTLALSSKSASCGLQQLRLTECNVVNMAAVGRDGLEHVTTLALLRMSGEF
jgi:hypothetical protein